MKYYLSALLIFSLLILSSGFKRKNRIIAADEPFKQAFLEQINQVRRTGCKCGTNYMPPAPPLIWNDDLEKAAAAHASDMYQKNYFSHTGKNGSNPQDRIIKAGYGYKGFKSYAAGENIAFGQEHIDEVMNGWIKSEGHCRNLMNPAFKEVGVAEDHHYWVQEFGGREAFSAEEQKLINSGKYHLLPEKTYRQ